MFPSCGDLLSYLVNRGRWPALIGVQGGPPNRSRRKRASIADDGCTGLYARWIKDSSSHPPATETGVDDCRPARGIFGTQYISPTGLEVLHLESFNGLQPEQ